MPVPGMVLVMLGMLACCSSSTAVQGRCRAHDDRTTVYGDVDALRKQLGHVDDEARIAADAARAEAGLLGSGLKTQAHRQSDLRRLSQASENLDLPSRRRSPIAVVVRLKPLESW